MDIIDTIYLECPLGQKDRELTFEIQSFSIKVPLKDNVDSVRINMNGFPYMKQVYVKHFNIEPKPTLFVGRMVNTKLDNKLRRCYGYNLKPITIDAFSGFTFKRIHDISFHMSTYGVLYYR